MPALRVAFVAPFGLYRRGTTVARVIPLAEALAARGHMVRVVIPDWDCSGHSPPEPRIGSAEIVHLREPRAARRLLSLPLLRETVRAALAFKPDVVHCFKPIGYSGAVAMLLRAPTRPRGWCGLLAVDTDDLEGSEGWATAAGRPGWQSWLLDWQERRAIKAVDLVTAASTELVCRARRTRAPITRICYLPNAVRLPAVPTQFPLNRGSAMAPRALLYTRFNEFEPIRGADVLAAVLLQAPHARLDIVGDGPVNRVQAFFRQLERRGVLNRTKWHGLLRGDSLGKALSSDGVVIWLFEDNHTNRARSPAKLLELLAHGNAVIAERVGEVERLVSSAALTVAPGDAAELLGAAVRLFDDEIERQELRRKAAWHAAARCSWADRAALLERFLCT